MLLPSLTRVLLQMQRDAGNVCSHILIQLHRDGKEAIGEVHCPQLEEAPGSGSAHQG